MMSSSENHWTDMHSTQPPRSLILLIISTVILGAVTITGCERNSEDDHEGATSAAVDDDLRDTATDDDRDSRTDERHRMVVEQLEARDIDDERVLQAMKQTPRHRYVPEDVRPHAYGDRPLPIGHDQTISQPYIVALMTQLLDVSSGDRVLEIGTGSGYQAAVLAELDTELYTIEIICELAERADTDLDETGYGDVEVTCGDGYQGWPEYAPFDRIIVTAAPPEIPEALVEQLAVGGRMVVPVGEGRQMLRIIEKTGDGETETTDTVPVQFVPMVPGDDE